jgi:hypothetical protein
MSIKRPERLRDIRIFLTRRGTCLTPRLFRDEYWRPALRAAGIDADPHQARHWFVTNALKTIEVVSKDEAELIRRKEELIQYMAWSSGERTLRAYEHIRREERFAVTMQSIHKRMQSRERNFATHLESLPATTDVLGGSKSSRSTSELLFVLGEDDDD